MSSWRTGEHRSLSPAPSVEKTRADAPDPPRSGGVGILACMATCGSPLQSVVYDRKHGQPRIEDAPGDPGHKVGRGSVANILAQRCIDPAPLRGKRTT